MSPNEAQLRAALREGEDDAVGVVNADAIIWAARLEQRNRHRRVLAVVGGAAAAAIVGLGVTGIVALGGGGSTPSQQANGGNSFNADSAGGGATRGAAGGRVPAAATKGEARRVACPSAPERFLLPGGGGTGQFGGSGPLFTTAVAAMKVCTFPANGSPSAHVLSGAQARAVSRALEGAPATRTSAVCPGQQPPAGSVELLAVSPTQVEAKPVVITLGCPTNQVSNGTAVRYPRTLPPVLAQLLPAAKPAR
jgi:hypothetical protein